MTLPEYYNGTSWIPIIGTVTSVGITGSTGLGVTGSPITSAGTINLTLGSELQALSAFASTGLMARTGSGSYAGRTLTASTGINIVNGDGIFGNPTISLTTQLQNLNNLNTLGFISLITTGTGASTFANRTLTAGTGIAITNTNGVSGNPTISVSNVPISSLSGYPADSSLYLNGLGSWTNPLGSLSILGDVISSTTGKIGFSDPVHMNSNALYLTTTTNYGLLFNSSLSATEFRGFSGFTWKTGTAGATERMRLTSSGLSLNSSKLLDVSTPTTSTDGANKSYVDSKLSPVEEKLQYLEFVASNTQYPMKLIRPLYIQTTHSVPLIEYGSYGYLNSGGNIGTASAAPIYDLKCNNRIRASEFNAWSSKNIKNILETGQKANDEAAELIQNMPIAKYNYKDQVMDGIGEFFGVISEEILNYLPHYVTTKEFKFVPNIMKFGKLNRINDSTFTILLQDKIDLEKDIVGEQIQIIVDELATEACVISLQNKELLTIDMQKRVSVTDKDIDVFVYGTYKDCPTVSVKHLSELTLCAVQNCLERITNLEKKVKI